MEKYIPLDAVLVEIENIRKHYIERDDFDNGWNFALDKVLSFLDTLEVKEVDLEKEIEKQFDFHKNSNDNSLVKGFVVMNKGGFEYFAKHFFELGLKAQQL